MDPARQRLAAVVAAPPQDTTARFFLGEVAEKTGDRTGAIAQYGAVVTIDHNSTMALNKLAYLLSKRRPGLKP
jgi:predicted TPR repeat methyltransferase